MYHTAEDTIVNDINWKRPWITQEDSGMDYRKYRREFSGRMTPKRYAILKNYCERNSFRLHCHHEWDCCGCLCGQSMSFSYRSNQVVIGITQSFNY